MQEKNKPDSAANGASRLSIANMSTEDTESTLKCWQIQSLQSITEIDSFEKTQSLTLDHKKYERAQSFQMIIEYGADLKHLERHLADDEGDILEFLKQTNPTLLTKKEPKNKDIDTLREAMKSYNIDLESMKIFISTNFNKYEGEEIIRELEKEGRTKSITI